VANVVGGEGHCRDFTRAPGPDRAGGSD
jgi:hypothetical protein